MTRNRKQRRAAERKTGASTSANTHASSEIKKTAGVPVPPASSSSSSPPVPAAIARTGSSSSMLLATASSTSSIASRSSITSEPIRSSSSASIDMSDPVCAAAMSFACSAPIEEIRESLPQPNPPTLRRTLSTTSKSGRARIKDELPPSPFSPESPASPTAGSVQGSAPGLRSAAETSIDTLDDYIPALLANTRKGSPAPPPPAKSPPPTARVAAKSPPPPPATRPVSSKSPSSKSPLSPSSSATKSDQPDSSIILRTSILDQSAIKALSPTPTPTPTAQLTADGKLTTRAALPLALAQARTALLAATHTSSSSSPSSAGAHANQGIWDAPTCRFHVAHPRGSVLPRMGQRGIHNARILWPEEGMYLIARGDLVVDVKGEACEWPVDRWYEEMVAGAGRRMREMYLVYVQLKDAGYMVTRAGQGFVHPSAVSPSRAARAPASTSIFSTTLTHFWPKHSRFPTAVALVLRLATLYLACIWRFVVQPVVSRTRLHTLVLAPPTPAPRQQQQHEPTWEFDVWKPMSVTAAKFKPSDPPRPDFAVSVVDAERMSEGGMPIVDVGQEGVGEQLVAVVDQASVHFYAVGERGRHVIGD